MKEKWILEAKKADFDKIGKKFSISPVTARLLVNRGLTKEDEIDRYLKCNLESMYSGKMMKDMERAVLLIANEIRQNRRITIGTDFDNDGILSGYMLHYAILRVGGSAEIYAPDRVSEGYGLNRRIVDDAINAGSRFIVTCDNGISAFDAIDYAKSKGMTVVVTDHHEVAFDEGTDGTRSFRIPAADAVVNPKQQDCPYPFKGLCGAGVVFKLVQLLYETFDIAKSEAYDLLEYTAIATVADVMDLVDENRTIVKYGLSRLRNTKNIGLRALMEECSLNMERLSSYHIGFVIGPCFNAAGRLDTVDMALDLLQCQSETKAKQLAKSLHDLNESRKEMTLLGVEQAVTCIETSNLKNDKVLLVHLENTHESLVGIIAGRIREAYHKPTLVFADAKDGLKGSGRSIEAYNMFEELLKCKALLTKFGGHKMAAGLSLEKGNLDELRYQLNENTTLTENDLLPVVRIDVPLPIGYINQKLIDELELLEPFGKGNSKPVFAEQHFKIRKASIMGKNQKVLKMSINNECGDSMDALYFGNIKEFMSFLEKEFGTQEVRKMYQGQYNEIDVAFTYYPSINEFRGTVSLQIIVQNYCRIKN